MPGTESLFASPRTLELGTATSLAPALASKRKRDAARALLAPLYAWFTEGFATRDLKDGKALARRLAGILFALWRDGTTFDPARVGRRRAGMSAAA